MTIVDMRLGLNELKKSHGKISTHMNKLDDEIQENKRATANNTESIDACLTLIEEMNKTIKKLEAHVNKKSPVNTLRRWQDRRDTLMHDAMKTVERGRTKKKKKKKKKGKTKHKN